MIFSQHNYQKHVKSMSSRLLIGLSIFVFSIGSAFAQNNSGVELNTEDSRLDQQLRKHQTVATIHDYEEIFHDHQGEKCWKSPMEEKLIAEKPGYREALQRAKNQTRRIEGEFLAGTRTAPPIYTIPIVFHVIHKGEAVGSGTNISTAQIQSSVDALNRDFRRTNADGGIAEGAGPDTEIQFCLASVDENGNPHSGINRVNGNSVSQYSSQGITGSNELAVKNLSRWDNRYYLNIWVVAEINDNNADVANPANFFGGTLGYAYLPTNPVTWNSDLDGIVAINLCVGNDPNQSNNYRLWPWGGLTNRTVTHEVGHFLDLNHTFEGNSCSESNCNTQGDEICDTPPTVNGSDCNSPACTNTIVENYMDYTGEECQDMFTNGQSTRMRAALAGVRNLLVNTSNCTVSSGNDWDASVSAIVSPSGTLCDGTFTPMVTLTNVGDNTLTSVNITYNVDGGGAQTYNWNGSLSAGESVNVTLGSTTASAGAHTFNASTVSGTLNGSNTDEDTSNDGSSSSFTVTSGAGSSVTLTLDLDCYGDETTWEILDDNNAVVASGGPYVNNQPAGEQQVYSLCLPEGCYVFVIEDTYGDGLYGSQWTCTVDGDYEITDSQNQTLVEMTAPNGDFGYSASHPFCIGNPVVSDCDSLVYFDGGSFFPNDLDEPNFEVMSIDNDGEALATPLANAGYSSNYMIFYEVPNPGDTNLFTRVTSWFADTTQLSDNWLTFGPMTIPSDGAELSWYHRYVDNDYRDGYRLLVGTTGTDIADFAGATEIFSVTDNDPSTDGDNDWTENTYSFDAVTYAGQSVYLAIHHESLNMYFLDLDELYMEGCSTSPVGIGPMEDLQFGVYPNPTEGNLTVSHNAYQSASLIIRDAVGRVVLVSPVGASANRTDLDLNHLVTGVYTVSLESTEGRVSKRFILN